MTLKADSTQQAFALVVLVAAVFVGVLLVNLHYPSVQGLPIAQPGAVVLGDEVRVNITVTSVTDLMGVELGIGFDGSILVLDDYVQGPFLESDGAQAYFFE